MLAYIDYALIVVFFVVLFGLVLWIASPRKEDVLDILEMRPCNELRSTPSVSKVDRHVSALYSAQAQALPPPRENKLAYGFLAALFVLFFVLTILDQRQQAHAGS